MVETYVVMVVVKGDGRAEYSVREVSLFATCPHLYLREKLRRKHVTPAMKRGLERHVRAYREHVREAVKVSLKEAVELSKGVRVVGREVWLSDGIVGGYADYIEVYDGSARVVEYKTTEKAARWRPSWYQALFYGVLLKSFVEEVVAEVRDFEERLHFRRRVRERDEMFLESTVEEMKRSEVEGRFEGKRGAHCRQCPFRVSCVFLKEEGEDIMGVVEVAGDGRVLL